LNRRSDEKPRRGCFSNCFVTFLILVILLSCGLFLWADLSTSLTERPASLDKTGLFSMTANILILGSDTRESGESGRADTIMILGLKMFRKSNSLLSIPRDSRVEIEGHGIGKINAAYFYEGQDLMVSTVKNLTDLKINHIIEMDFQGFKELVDAVGGVTINVSERLVDDKSGANFEPGTYLMDGDQALAFVRSRATASADLGRIERQQYFLRQLMKRLADPSVFVLRSPKIFLALKNNVKTDMNAAHLFKYGIFMAWFGLKGLNAETLPGKTATIDGVSYVVIDQGKAFDTIERLFGD